MLSKSAEYAIRAMIYLEVKSDGKSNLGIKAIADEIGSPVHFTAKILQVLAKQGLISSIKGPNGGFCINKDAPPVKLIQVIEAIDGKRIFTGCIIGLKNCSDSNPCPIHNEYKVARNKLLIMFNERSIRDIAFNNNKLILKRK